MASSLRIAAWVSKGADAGGQEPEVGTGVADVSEGSSTEWYSSARNLFFKTFFSLIGLRVLCGALSQGMAWIQGMIPQKVRIQVQHDPVV